MILVFNAGSSSLKFSLFASNGMTERMAGTFDWKTDGLADVSIRRENSDEQSTQIEVSSHGDAVHKIVEAVSDLGQVRQVGHRFVHGGERFREPTPLSCEIVEELHQLSQLAPLHNPIALEVVQAAQAALPDVPQTAVFDTSFFASLPESAYRYPVPYDWYETYGIRRYGFHGISHDYCARRTVELLGQTPDRPLRIITCHLGNGCSATATVGGVPMNTTMGLTPLEGLMMGTRSGSIDPGILLHLLRQGMSVDAIDSALNRESGLLGVSGISSDYRLLEDRAESSDTRAKLAIKMFADRVSSSIASLGTSMGGLDAIAFTAGIGEHAVKLRAQVCGNLEFIGVNLSESQNQANPTDAIISNDASRVKVLVIAAREELAIAQAILAGCQCN